MLYDGETVRVSGRSYVLREKIGTGTFGEVYLCQGPDGQALAAKVLTVELNPRRVQAFKDEFSFLTQLKHPGLCIPYDFGLSNELGRYLYLSEYADGRPFFEATEGLTPHEIEGLAVSLFEVLDYLHRHEVIHFDIKCPNILVNAGGSLKLLDFGFAHIASAPLTRYPGTLRYAAPEILLRSQSSDHRADLYSLGIVLYRALTRRFPFDDSDPSAITDWHLGGKISWNGHDCESIPGYLRQLVQALLKRSPAERLSAASAAARWLKLHREGTAPRGRSHPPSVGGEAPMLARAQEIAAAFQALSEPAGQVFALLGDRGIGKSRLLQEIKFEAEIRELNCLWIDQLDHEDGLSQVKRQLQLEASLPPEELFRRSVQRFEKATALFVDDTQDGDPLFWEWLARLAGHPGRLCLFLAWEGALPTHGPLPSLFQSARILPLTPWGQKEIRQYVTELSEGKEPTDEWVTSLLEFSAGLPLLVTSGARFLLGGEGKIPETIERLYEEVLAPLSTETRELLEILSLWPRAASLGEISEACPLPVAPLSTLLLYLISQGLVSRLSSPEEPDIRYRLANRALALVLEKGQTEDKKRARGTAIFSCLEATPGTTLETLAAYALLAGERKKAFSYLLKLAESQERAFQTDRAIESYKRLLGLVQEGSEISLQTQKRLIHLLVLAGRAEDARTLLPHGERLTPKELKLKGWTLLKLGRFAEAEAVYQLGLGQSDEEDPIHRELWNDLGNVLLQTGKIEKATALFRKTVGDPELLKNNSLSLALALSGDFEEARRFETERLETFRRSGDQHLLASALSQLGFIELKAQNLPAAEAAFEESLTISEQSGDLHNILIVLDNLITISLRQGLYDKAIDAFSRASRYRQILSPSYQQAQNDLKGAFLYLSLSLPEPARLCLERIRGILPEVESPTLKGWVHLAWGYYDRVVGDFGRAASDFREAARTAMRLHDSGLETWGHYALADLWVHQEKWSRAVKEYEKSRETLPENGDEELRLRVDFLALILRKAGRLPSHQDPAREMQSLAEASEAKGFREIAAEIYSQCDCDRARKIYREIASRLPEEYRMAYLSDPTRQQVMGRAGH